ncbi:GDSL-type esterase/lipase family protein [Anaerostipes hadrus]|uniref:GDSL-type esterase/lipase family protein n=1 Tax=Anaerostipes hadrus TaxID=649756 RepID=UPI0034A3BD76
MKKVSNNSLFFKLLSLLLFVSLIFVLFSSGYANRIAYKIGIKFESPIKTDSYNSWENCLKQLNVKSDIVFIGDSLTANGNFQKAFPNTSVCNLGCYGDRIVNVRSRISTVSSLHPSKVFIACGVNSLACRNLKTCKYQYSMLINECKKTVPNTEIFVCSVLPTANAKNPYCSNSKIRSFNNFLKKLSQKHNLQFIDLYSAYEQNGYLPNKYTNDGLHLTPDSYSIWYKSVSKYINS